jgi:hypothetical protein
MLQKRFVCSNEIITAALYGAGNMISVSRFYPCLHNFNRPFTHTDGAGMVYVKSGILEKTVLGIFT